MQILTSCPGGENWLVTSPRYGTITAEHHQHRWTVVLGAGLREVSGQTRRFRFSALADI